MNYETTEITVNVGSLSQVFKAYFCPECPGEGRISNLDFMSAHIQKHKQNGFEVRICTVKACQVEFRVAIIDGVTLPTTKCPKCRTKGTGGRKAAAPAPRAMLGIHQNGKRAPRQGGTVGKGSRTKSSVFC
jgi:hypothetical protein